MTKISSPYKTEAFRAYSRARSRERMKGVKLIGVKVDTQMHKDLKRRVGELGLNVQTVLKLLVISFLKGDLNINVAVERAEEDASNIG
jgi:hypothetical protein|tara:strand:+ start:522 stop:785 length:264 start_codon:yes stop_codon:yes gene_type:complete